MARIPDNPFDSTVQIYEASKAKAMARDPRPQFGASMLGMECPRAAWFSFHWMARPKSDFDGQTQRAFEAAYRVERAMAAELRKIGAEVHTFNPAKSSPGYPEPPIRVEHWNGWVGGRVQGVGRNLPEAPKSWHVLSFKSFQEKRFKAIQKKGIEKEHYALFCELQFYMGKMGMTRAFCMMENKNTSELHVERIKYSARLFETLVKKAHLIIWGVGIPGKISDDPKSRDCVGCDFNKQCHESARALASCRTCEFHEFGKDGFFYCLKNNKKEIKTTKEQVKGCDDYSRWFFNEI